MDVADLPQAERASVFAHKRPVLQKTEPPAHLCPEPIEPDPSVEMVETDLGRIPKAEWEVIKTARAGYAARDELQEQIDFIRWAAADKVSEST